MDKFNILDIFEVGGFTKADAGPSVRFDVAFGQETTFDFVLQGSTRLLDMSARLYMGFGVGWVKFDLDMDLVIATISMNVSAATATTATAATTQRAPEFQVDALFDLSALDHIIEELPEKLHEIEQKSTAAINEAEHAVWQWDSAVQSLQRKIDAATARDDALKATAEQGCAAAQRGLTAAQNKVDSIQGTLDSLEHKIAHASWWDWFGRAEGWVIQLGVMEAAKLVADAVLSLARLAFSAVAAIVQAFPIAALDPEIIALRVAQGTIKGFQVIAIATLQTAKAAVNGLMQLLAYLTKGLLSLFELFFIKFHMALADLSKGKLPDLELKFSFLGKLHDWKFDGFSFTDFGPLVLNLAYKLLGLFTP